MIVRLEQKESSIFGAFLQDAKLFRMPRTAQVALNKLLSDVKSGQVNTDRFRHAYPVIDSVYSSLHTRVSLIFKWKQIPKWKKYLLIPALYDYFFIIVPRRRAARTALNQVGAVVKRIKSFSGKA